MTNPRTRYRLLLDKGFYPVELPPIFRTTKFGSCWGKLSPPKSYSGSTIFFDGPTFKGNLRTFGIINPINYMMLSEHIARNWLNIKKVYNLSNSSGSRPQFDVNPSANRAISSSDINTKRKSQAHLAGIYPIIAGFDINRFYSSVYTHSLPWAVLGKSTAKAMFKAKTLDSHWSAELDRLIRNGNQRQSVGIPIGPDTSRIISEIILSRIDKELTTRPSPLRAQQIYHNIDDYQMGVPDIAASEHAQRTFVSALAKYELKINDFKTSIKQGMAFKPGFFQRRFDCLSNATGKELIEHFFELIYQDLEENNVDNVIGYAIKRFERKLLLAGKDDLLREYLQRLLLAAPHHVRWIAPLLIGIYGNLSDRDQLNHVIKICIDSSTRKNDTITTLWLIYMCLCLKLRLNRSSCSLCAEMSSELVDITLLHGKNIGIFEFNVSSIRARYKNTDFSSTAWLILYEVQRNNWDTTSPFNKLGKTEDKDNLFKTMLDLGIGFYDCSNEALTVSAIKSTNLRPIDFAVEKDAFDWDPLDDWDEANY